MDKNLLTKLREIQNRVNEALIESPEDFRQSSFSEYLPDDSWKISDNFQIIAEGKDIEGIEAAMDEFDRLTETEDRVRLQHALMVFLANNQAFSGYGLRIPSLEKRGDWKTLPSRKITSRLENN